MDLYGKFGWRDGPLHFPWNIWDSSMDPNPMDTIVVPITDPMDGTGIVTYI